MKVPTFRKYGITKSQFKNIENHAEKVTHYVTHLLPILIGFTGGIILYLLVFRKFSPHGIPQYIQQIFVLVTIIVICIGISMMLFKGIYYVYNAVLYKSSTKYKKAKNYTEDRDKYEFWKLRMDENYWLYLDSLSIENEILYMYSMMGYNLRSEVSNEPNHLAYILNNDANNKIYLSCYSLKKIQTPEELNKILTSRPEIKADEFHLVCVKGFDKNLRFQIIDSKIKLFSPVDVTLMANEREKVGKI